MNSTEISNLISSTINNLFHKLFSSIDDSLYSLLDNFTFIDSSVLKDSYFDTIFGVFTGEGLLLIANALVIGFLIYYAFCFLLAHLGVTQAEHPAKFLFKLLFCTIAMNFSPFICYEIIDLIDLLSRTIRLMGENLLNTPICFASVISKLNMLLVISNSFDVFTMDGFIKSIASVILLSLLITYSIRYVLIKVFVLLSPFAFLSLSNKSTSILFLSWLKSFFSLLFIQVFVSIVLLLVLSLNIYSNQLFSRFILIAALYILIKANHYVREMLGGIHTDVGIGLGQLKKMFFN